MRYNGKGQEIKTPEIDSFLEEVQSLCFKYGYSIGHEDGHGGFEICDISEDPHGAWLFDASDRTKR